ncbi:hypothetical protein ACQKNC_05815 [Lysinibacillus sp. NPDC094177]|uniref:hypothetical protein n=1 Tax=Lysinibacillus sp. NPDC094177 TaxID=3390580 RepID=UPI003CFF70F9
MMRDIFLFWSKIVTRSDYLLTYYAIVIILCISQFFFTMSDAQALIPLYGIFSSVLTTQIITLHQRYQVEKILMISPLSNRTLVSWQWLFSFILAIPAFMLLVGFEKYVYAETPIYKILLIVFVFQLFTISIPFLFSAIFSNQSVSIIMIVIIYFLLMLMHGYRLEIIQYIAPTLNFMYPDYIHFLNLMGVLTICLGSIAAAILFSKRTSVRKEKWVAGCFTSIMLLILISLHLYDGYKEKELLIRPYQSYTFEEFTVEYKGVSREKANNYALVYKDITQEMRGFGVGTTYHTLKVTRVYSIPRSDRIENIISRSRDTVEISPYSNKFFEFNYGYNITEDLINTLMSETWKTEEQTNCYEILKKTIEQKVILTNNRTLFSNVKKESMESLEFNTTELYVENFLNVLNENPKNAYQYIVKLKAN